MSDLLQNPRYQRLKGGWFVGPDEYAQMGFTLGLPPGFYAPDKPEIRELVSKIRKQNGIILPSTVAALKQNGQSSKKTVIVTNVTVGIKEEAIIREVSMQLQKRKLVSDPDPIISCDIQSSKFIAYLQMRTQKDAEAAVSLGSIIIDQQVMRISMDKGQDMITKGVASNQNAVKQEIDYLNAIIVDSILPLPSAESIKECFEKQFEVESIIRSEGFEHAIVMLKNPDLTDVAIYKLDNVVVDGVKLRVRRAFIDESNKSSLLDDNERRKMKISEGPSNLLTVLSPYMREKPCIADILNPDVPVSVVIHQETERLQKSTGSTLLLYNIAPQITLYDNDECIDIINDIKDECNKFGKVLECMVDKLISEALPSDYAVVKVIFENHNDAKDAQIALSGRRYAGRIVITQLID